MPSYLIHSYTDRGTTPLSTLATPSLTRATRLFLAQVKEHSGLDDTVLLIHRTRQHDAILASKSTGSMEAHFHWAYFRRLP